MAKFVSIISFSADTEKRLDIRPKHREYLAYLLEQGKLHESGPFADDSGALIIYEAADEAEARAIIAADPYAGTGVIADLQLREWKRVLPA
jgi:uncharacterized protein YciI